MGIPLHVLIVEDSEIDARLLILELKHGGFEPLHERVETADALRAALRNTSWDIILCDYSLPDLTGLEALAILKETGSDIPFIIISGAIGEEVAVETMKAGAHDYIMKDRRQRLLPAVERELREAAMRREHRQVEAALWEEQRRSREIAERLAGELAVIAEIGRLIGSTLAIGEVYERVAAETRKLIPFDRLSVSLNNPSDGTQTVAHVAGLDIAGRRPGDSFPLKGTINELLMGSRTGLLIPSADIAGLVDRMPGLLIVARSAMHSVMSVPLIVRDEVIGALHFQVAETGSIPSGGSPSGRADRRADCRGHRQRAAVCRPQRDGTFAQGE